MLNKSQDCFLFWGEQARSEGMNPGCTEADSFLMDSCLDRKLTFSVAWPHLLNFSSSVIFLSLYVCPCLRGGLLSPLPNAWSSKPRSCYPIIIRKETSSASQACAPVSCVRDNLNKTLLSDPDLVGKTGGSRYKWYKTLNLKVGNQSCSSLIFEVSTSLLWVLLALLLPQSGPSSVKAAEMV